MVTSANDPLVVAVVVTYRETRLTIGCVESLLRSNGVTLHVVIVDNGSGDDTTQVLRAHFGNSRDVSIHERTTNAGYTGGVNDGLALARRLCPDARHAFILNNDTIVHADCVRRLVADAEHDERIALATPRIFLGEPSDRLWFGGGALSPWRGRPIHVGYRERAPSTGPWSVARDVTYASGCSLLVRLSAISDPLFDASLFTYAEDVDLTFRVQREGSRIRYVPDAVVWHFEGTGHRGAGGQSLRVYLNVRNLLRVNAKHARWYHWPTLGPSLAIDVVGRYAVRSIRDRDWEAFGSVFRGAWDALKGELRIE